MSTLLDKLCTIDNLYTAWNLIKNKNAVSGIDKMTILDFENDLSKNLKLLQEELQIREWIPRPYLRLEIKKNETETRKLGLLTIKDFFRCYILLHGQ